MTKPLDFAGAIQASAMALFVITALVMALWLLDAQAQEPSEDDIAAILVGLQASPDALESRIKTLKARLERKRAHLTILNKSLEQARAARNDDLKARLVSRYAYQTFLVFSHVEADANKLQDAEAMKAIVPLLGTEQAPALIGKEIGAAPATRRKTAERLELKAGEFRPLITDPGFKGQFEQLVRSIRSELEQQEEKR